MQRPACVGEVSVHWWKHRDILDCSVDEARIDRRYPADVMYAVADEVLVGIKPGDDDPQQIVGRSGHQVAFQYLVECLDASLEMPNWSPQCGVPVGYG